MIVLTMVTGSGDLATTGLNFRSYDSVLALTGKKPGRSVNTGASFNFHNFSETERPT